MTINTDDLTVAVGQGFVLSLAKLCPTLCNPTDVAQQTPLPMEFSRQEYGVGCHALLQGIVWTQGLNRGLLHLLHWQVNSLLLYHWLWLNFSHEFSIKMLARVTVIWGLGWRWKITFQDVTVQSLSHVWHSATPETTTCQSSLSFTNLLNSCSRNLLKLMFVESVNQPSHPVTSVSCSQSFPASLSFSNESPLHIRWPKYWSSSFSISLPMNIQGWFPLRLADLISLLSKGLSRVFSSTAVWKHRFFGSQLSLWSPSHIHTWLLEIP